MKLFRLLLILLLPYQVQALEFTEAVNVTGQQANVFHHLDASGRKNIATSRTQVAVVWEDNRSGQPRVYTAFKPFSQAGFSPALQLSSSQHEAFEPTLLAVSDDTFIYAWEENQYLWFTRVTNRQVANPQRLDSFPATQVSLARTSGDKIYAAWIQHNQGQHQLVISEIRFTDATASVSTPVVVDKNSTTRNQAYPSLVAINNQLVVGWEDREHGHTRLYTSYSTDGKHFSQKRLLNKFIPPPNPKYGRGTGATRIALASNDKQVAAAWMDKRDFLGGYDIYAAISTDNGKSFGENEKAQDMLGENTPQWHPASAISSNGQLVVAWDDPRDDSPDIWYSVRQPHGWSDDETLDAGSGAGAQTSPSLAFDQQGRLHLVWLSQSGQGNQLLYTHSQ